MKNQISLAAIFLFIIAMLFTSHASAETVCGPEIKSKVAEALMSFAKLPAQEKLAAEKALYKEFAYCAEENTDNADFKKAALQCGARVSQLGSLFYEEMSCCGYDPQRREFGCPVKIKQTFGFGGSPLPGSREHVLHCVADANGTLMPVGRDSVHLANEMHGAQPSWQFAVNVNASENLQTVYPMNGETRRARSILSWGFEPTSCDFQPIWGNALNYRIRLDQ